MLKKRSSKLAAVMLGCMLFASITFIGCNNGDTDKKSDTPVKDSTEVIDTGGLTKPIKTVP